MNDISRTGYSALLHCASNLINLCGVAVVKIAVFLENNRALS